MKTIHCPWCSKEVKITKKQRLCQHQGYSRGNCLGSGATTTIVNMINNKQINKN